MLRGRDSQAFNRLENTRIWASSPYAYSIHKYKIHLRSYLWQITNAEKENKMQIRKEGALSLQKNKFKSFQKSTALQLERSLATVDGWIIHSLTLLVKLRNDSRLCRESPDSLVQVRLII